MPIILTDSILLDIMAVCVAVLAIVFTLVVVIDRWVHRDEE